MPGRPPLPAVGAAPALPEAAGAAVVVALDPPPQAPSDATRVIAAPRAAPREPMILRVVKMILS